MDVKSIKWREDRVLVLPDAVSDKFEQSKLIKPDIVKAAEKANRGVIVSVGTGRIDPNTGIFVAQELTVGQRIIFGHWAGVEFEHEGVKYKVMRPDDVFGELPG